MVALGREPSVSERLRKTVLVAAEATGARFGALAFRTARGRVERLVLSDPDPAAGHLVRRELARHRRPGSARPSGPGPAQAGEDLDLLAVPLPPGRGVDGPLSVLGSDRRGGFTAEDARLLASLAETTASGVGCTTLLTEA